VKSHLLISLELLIDLQDALNLFLFGLNDALQNGYFIVIEANEIGFSLLIGVPFFGKLFIIEFGQLCETNIVSVIIFLEFITKISILIDKLSQL
jgi:hypothetical protein